jgi:hypothetical protein
LYSVLGRSVPKFTRRYSRRGRQPRVKACTRCRCSSRRPGTRGRRCSRGDRTNPYTLPRACSRRLWCRASYSLPGKSPPPCIRCRRRIGRYRARGKISVSNRYRRDSRRRSRTRSPRLRKHPPRTQRASEPNLAAPSTHHK